MVERVRICNECGKEYATRGPNSKHCPECAAIIAKEMSRVCCLERYWRNRGAVDWKVRAQNPGQGTTIKCVLCGKYDTRGHSGAKYCLDCISEADRETKRKWTLGEYHRKKGRKNWRELAKKPTSRGRSMDRIAIKDRQRFSDFIYYKEEELNIKSHKEMGLLCGLHETHITHLDHMEIGSIEQKTLTNLARGLQMTEQEIIEKGGLTR